MSHRSFYAAVISGGSLSHESFAFDVTALEYTRNVLLAPYGRGYPGQWWQGMQRPAGVVGHRMQRIIEDDGTHFFSSDDVEYRQPYSKRYRDEIVNGQAERTPVQEPWRRLTPKFTPGGYRVRVGAERRARLRAERVSPL